MTTQPNNPAPQSSEWAPCAPGDLEDASKRLRSRDALQRQSYVMRVGGVVALGVVLLAVSVGLVQGDKFRCKECASHFDEYHLHLAGEAAMPAAVVSKVERHLSYCKMCQAHYERKFPGELEEAGVSALSGPAPSPVLASLASP